ncbi:IclR family transcriptional regulator [Novosphingobium sp. 9U]|uniref:IclR family transcriptional regulator n=1 Tax=Novosphingobium sp. 9U TaxID=2653158 RepID=UPI0012F25E00|nr:helix-turn-helix domain-containing protein [Novosphingobium sp. 9U]VWX46503.1 Transcriptional regulator [Novosphingobium sp. 9U]
MSRSSPGVRRVAAILNFIADHPGQAFALTDLVRALKLSRATCHALLTGLVDVGYLYRTGDKTYVLGPALAAIGRTAADHFSPLQVAQPEMRAIADDFDVICGAYFLEGDMMHLRERATSAHHVGYPVPLGTRMPLTMAQAPVFFARAPKDATAWLERNIPDATQERSDLLAAGIEFTREHGYIGLVRRPGVEPSFENVSSPLRTARDDPPVIPLLQVEDGTRYPLAAIMAPIYDARGKVTIALLMAGFHDAQSGAQLQVAGKRLSAACQRVSDFLSGRSVDSED